MNHHTNPSLSRLLSSEFTSQVGPAWQGGKEKMTKLRPCWQAKGQLKATLWAPAFYRVSISYILTLVLFTVLPVMFFFYTTFPNQKQKNKTNSNHGRTSRPKHVIQIFVCFCFFLFFNHQNGPIIALSWGFQPGVSNTPGKGLKLAKLALPSTVFQLVVMDVLGLHCNDSTAGCKIEKEMQNKEARFK